MKNFIIAIIFSAGLHIIYFATMFLTGYVQTLNYKPDLAGKWESVTYLQNEVAFGYAGLPVLYLFTFIGVVLAISVGLFLKKKLAE
ncbi:hypothetical protein D1B31_00915 [Neobacillus notoginsengisoli]|uniref:Uncharacterized protein n=1 Tax=Neobacillus notoginsengisoli TaxID=1578198 RepID=A0A417YZF8_9BACI|nr:hypothetical protein [Neobacillus notoginsengisoli]RHW43267.1 hypothetical protein D1B31_00915 [Neobacillus notoginsengisoli]